MLPGARLQQLHELLSQYGIKQFKQTSSAIRLSSLACVAFITCPLALAEAQRYIPAMITKVEPILANQQKLLVISHTKWITAN